MKNTWVCLFHQCPHNLWSVNITQPKKRHGTQDFKPIKVIITPKAQQIHGCCLNILSPWTLEDIAQVWEFSKERIRQVQDEAIAKIKASHLIQE